MASDGRMGVFFFFNTAVGCDCDLSDMLMQFNEC